MGNIPSSIFLKVGAQSPRFSLSERPPLSFRHLMKAPLSFLSCLTLILGLTQCVGPDGRPMSPFGPVPPRPYSDQREQYRNDVRDYSQEENQRANERGEEDGRLDYAGGEQRSYLRHYRNYTEGTRAAYQDGYDRGYGTAPLSNGGANGSNGGGNDYRSQPDPSYNQGYDYGLRDRVAGRPSDPGAYTGSYDPRFRRSFEQGYADAYESGRSR